jgi:hypothetical protein
VTKPAWAAKPSWYMVATDDHMIPPVAQRAMSKRAGSSVVFLHCRRLPDGNFAGASHFVLHSLEGMDISAINPPYLLL